jgi:hypothetical protein
VSKPRHRAQARPGDDQREQRRDQDAEPGHDQQRRPQVRDRGIDVVDGLRELDRPSVPGRGAGDAKVTPVDVGVPEHEAGVAARDRDVGAALGNRDGLVGRGLAAPIRERDAHVVARVRRGEAEVRQGDLGDGQLGEPGGVGADRVVGLVVQAVAHGEVRDDRRQHDGDGHREHAEQREADAEAHGSRST